MFFLVGGTMPPPLVELGIIHTSAQIRFEKISVFMIVECQCGHYVKKGTAIKIGIGVWKIVLTKI